jgi:hypothetical protein
MDQDVDYHHYSQGRSIFHGSGRDNKRVREEHGKLESHMSEAQERHVARIDPQLSVDLISSFPREIQSPCFILLPLVIHTLD